MAKKKTTPKAEDPRAADVVALVARVNIPAEMLGQKGRIERGTLFEATPDQAHTLLEIGYAEYR